MLEKNLVLEVLKEVSKIANSAPDLNNTLQKIIEVIKNKMTFDACSIFLLEENGSRLKVGASCGLPEDLLAKIQLELGQGVTGWVAQTKTSLALSEAMKDPRFHYFPDLAEENFKSLLSVPMVADQQCIGVINVHTVDRREFSSLEINLLETIANQVSGCVRNILIYNQSQRLLKEQSILYDISLAVQTSLKLEHGLWIILSGITREEAGGFNRSILLTVNESSGELHGIMGLGPDSPEDAHRIWSSINHKRNGITEWIISEAEKDEYSRSGFNEFAKDLRFPIEAGNNIFAECVLKKTLFNINDGQNHPLVPKDFLQATGVNSFAIVPLISHEEVLGIIYVDNRYNYQEIVDSHLNLLTRFATHASWVIENSRLFNKLLDTNRELLTIKGQLIEYEKLSALGELSAEVAHEIKNPLVSIGGFARRLKEKIENFPAVPQQKKEIESASNYSEIIVTEVGRLESLLKNILIYSKSGALNVHQGSLNSLLKEVIEIFQTGLFIKKIKIDVCYSGELEPIPMDVQKIRQVLINILFNSVESMPQGGKITIETYLDTHLNREKMATVKVSDTGGGIMPEVLANIFNPFFTTKDSGTGLGLSISQKIIESHGGSIRVENNPGIGVIVYLFFPLKLSSDYTKP